jgi:hypothetical protein
MRGVNEVLQFILVAIVPLGIAAAAIYFTLYINRWNRRVRVEGPPANPPAELAKFSRRFAVPFFLAAGVLVLSFTLWGGLWTLLFAVFCGAVGVWGLWLARKDSMRNPPT